MTEMAQNVQAVVKSVGNNVEIINYALEITKKQGGRSMTAQGFSAGSFEGLAEGLKKSAEENALEFILPPYEKRLNDIHTAVTPAHYGIAETGTLVVVSRSESLRIATMLPEVHIAVLNVSNIHTDSFALADILDAELKSSPGYLAFITGASRTADIERVLTIGVHGPKELHILLMEEKAND